MHSQTEPKKYVFIFPVYNEEVIVKKAISDFAGFVKTNSALYTNSLIVIADNKSTDKTAQIAKQLATETPNLIKYTYIAEKGRGNAIKHTVAKFSSHHYFY